MLDACVSAYLGRPPRTVSECWCWPNPDSTPQGGFGWRVLARSGPLMFWGAAQARERGAGRWLIAHFAVTGEAGQPLSGFILPHELLDALFAAILEGKRGFDVVAFLNGETGA